MNGHERSRMFVDPGSYSNKYTKDWRLSDIHYKMKIYMISTAMIV